MYRCLMSLKKQRGIYICSRRLRVGRYEEHATLLLGEAYIGFVLLPATVSKQVSLFLNKAFTTHHNPLLQVDSDRPTQSTHFNVALRSIPHWHHMSHQTGPHGTGSTPLGGGSAGRCFIEGINISKYGPLLFANEPKSFHQVMLYMGRL